MPENKGKTNEILNALAKAIEEFLPGYGFALLIFEFHKPGISSYISNAERKEMIIALREAADRFEKGQDWQPGQEN